jgi:DNA segregation ATPase FtsK/SpoIIIE, S-DNA-T family
VNAFDILGAVGAASLRDRLANLSEADGTARFMLDRLTGQQVAAVVQSLLRDPRPRPKSSLPYPVRLRTA